MVAARADAVADGRHKRLAMATDLDTEPFLTERSPVALKAPRLAPWLALAALFVVAVILRHVLPANADVSWLLTVAERVWDGQRLYVDVIETNPPMAVMVYIPGIAIARAVGLPAEMVIDGLVFAAIFGSLAIANANISRWWNCCRRWRSMPSG